VQGRVVLVTGAAKGIGAVRRRPGSAKAGAGPAPCLEIGRQVRYRQAAVERWLTGSIQAGSPEENR
jgi:hypothetical protein